MPVVRWLHRVWNIFWSILLVVLIVLTIGGGIFFGIVQLDSSKNYIASRIERNFSEKYNGVFTIGKLDGLIPFQIELEDVNLYADSSSIVPVLKSDKISANLDFFALLQQRFIVTGLNIQQPSILVDQNDKNSLLYALRKKDTVAVSDEYSTESESIQSEAPFFEILAPRAVISNGRIVLKNILKPNDEFQSLDSLVLSQFDLEMFFEYRKDERFLDITNLTFETNQPGIGRTLINGQIYSNERFLEFNSFNFVQDDSYISISGRLDGIDVYKPRIDDQFLEAEYDLDINEIAVSSDLINEFLFDSVVVTNPLTISSSVSGVLNDLRFEDTKVGYGGSQVLFSGLIKNAFDRDSLSYEAQIDKAQIDSLVADQFINSLDAAKRNAITGLNITGELRGTLSKITGNVEANGMRGSLAVNGEMGLDDNRLVNIGFKTDSLNVGGLLHDFIAHTDITSQGELIAEDYNDLLGFNWFSFSSSNFEINDSSFTNVELQAVGNDKVINPRFSFDVKEGTLDGDGLVDLSNENIKVELEGNGTNLDLRYLSQIEGLSEIVADVEYGLNFSGKSFREATGVLSIDIPNAIMGEDTLKPHLLYADLASNIDGKRSARVTTTALDFSIDGNFQQQSLQSLAIHWANYFSNRNDEELFLPVPGFSNEVNVTGAGDQDFSISAQLKDVGLLKTYFSKLPDFEASTRLNADITVDSSRLLFNASLRDSKIRMFEYEADTLQAQVTGSFRHKEQLKDFSDFLAQFTAANITSPFVTGKNVSTNLTLQQDSIRIVSSVDRLGENARLEVEGKGLLTENALVFEVDDFYMGSEFYAWNHKGTPKIIYYKGERLGFDDFTFENDDEFFSIEGSFSNNPEDSVSYLIRGVQLDRISDIISGKVDFGGILNGSFTTRTLTRIPTIEGRIDLNALSVNDQIVGDFDIVSMFNQDLNRFDTEVSVFTDSTIYPNYFERNDRNGQNINFDGYVLAPVNGVFPDTDSLFHFNLNFENIDLWITPFIIPKVFTEMAGSANGSGEIWGNLDTYDFNVDYEIGPEDAVYMKPRFIDTYYYAQGPVTFTRNNGLSFEDIFIIDPSGGMAVLNGEYNFNDFQPLHNMDLIIELDEFQFLNNKFDPNIPFFGEAYGTGTIGFSGTNQSPVLQTFDPIYISDFSKVELPLLEETEFEEDNKFIRFVDSFDGFGSDTTGAQVANTTTILTREIDPSELSFSERFTLDLQFIAENPMEVRLIFDQVTGDIITTEGTGRLRIRLEDEDLSIFGRFDISGGDYQFVSGDIFTRRFELEENGSLIWEGEPDNARVDINAVYSGRPNIRTLTTARAELDLEDPNNIQRRPVDLVLSITGSLSSIENEFYFRLPDNFESRQNTTLSTQIAALNRNEDEKLLQATSFLLMGDFIPASSITGASSLTDNFSGGSAVLNPLISSQVISPLLSNQINSLLRSDISSLDVDFNLNTYNQVDLGLALRLYNDRIILRREGQITGAQSNIGDIGATYRINRTFSVTAFHRQDPTFSNQSTGQESQQAQDINGVGVEAQVNFNTWKDFFRRLGSPFRKMFGSKKDDEPQKDEENPS